MFLKELWFHNKKAALIFILFILSCGYINYKQGAVAAPLFQYGMYSGKFFIADTQKVIRLYANDSLVDFTKYSMVERDMMEISLDNYINQEKTNSDVFSSMHHLFARLGIDGLMKKPNYTNTVTDAQFAEWYKKLVTKIIGHPIVKLNGYIQKYIWQSGRLMPVEEPLKINCLAAN
jgi:hypothetical protein